MIEAADFVFVCKDCVFLEHESHFKASGRGRFLSQSCLKCATSRRLFKSRTLGERLMQRLSYATETVLSNRQNLAPQEGYHNLGLASNELKTSQYCNVKREC